MAYDDSNVFARIIRGEIPCDKVLETEHSLAFRDIQPQRPVHVLVIPKGPYESFHAFVERASEAEQLDYLRAIAQVTERAGVRESGYRLLSNTGPDAGQEVPHLHVHVFGGAPLGPMVTPRRD